MSTILLQKKLERTEPKIPAIKISRLFILPWDWELPSTILQSVWASKHSQCRYAGAKGTIKSDGTVADQEFCAMGLLAHYYGWDGHNRVDAETLHSRLPAVRVFGQYIVSMNDKLGWDFRFIGNIIKTDGI